MLGIKRTTLRNFESLAAPLKFDLALAFCRFFIVGEKWLAVGGEDKISPKQKPDHISPSFWQTGKRHCMSLATEPVYHQIPPGTLFSVAWDKYLSMAYDRLDRLGPGPRLSIFEGDNPKILRNLMDHIIDFSLVGLTSVQAMRLLNALAHYAQSESATIKAGGLTADEREEVEGQARINGTFPSIANDNQAEYDKWFATAAKKYLASLEPMK